MKKTLLYSLILCLLSTSVFSQKIWKKTRISDNQKEILIERNIPLKSKVFSLNMEMLTSKLNLAPQRGLI